MPVFWTRSPALKFTATGATAVPITIDCAAFRLAISPSGSWLSHNLISSKAPSAPLLEASPL